MSPDSPSDPSTGKPAEDAQPEAEAAEAKQAGSSTPPSDAGAEPEAAPKRRRVRRPAKAPRGEQAEAKASKPGAESEPAPAKTRAKKAPAPAAEKAKAAEAPAEPARAPRRSAKAPGSRPRRVVRARARYVRTPARKARMVCVHLPGKSVAQARAILAFTPREVARDWSKLLESAVANAENNHELLEDDLIIREAYADEGPTIKRFRPRAMGRATPIRKRTSHLTITLTASLDTTKRAS
jgi:ribosomal protein L22